MARVCLPRHARHDRREESHPFGVKPVANIKARRTPHDRFKKVTIVKRLMELQAMEVDVLQIIDKMTPLIIEHQKEIELTGGLAASNVVQLLLDPLERHVSESLIDLTIHQATKNGSVVLP